MLKLEREQKKTEPIYAAERDSRAGGPMDQLVLHQIVQGEKNSSTWLIVGVYPTIVGTS